MMRTKTLSALVVLILAGIIGCASNQKTRLPLYAPPAKDLVGLALAAMGGEEKLRHLQSLCLHAKGHQKVLAQPDLVEGPWTTLYQVWGEVTTRIVYSKWLLRPDGISYPMQMDISHHDWPVSSYNLLKVELNAPMPDSLFAIPEGVKAAYRARLEAGNRNAPSPRLAPVEIAPGIVQMSGGINATIIRQDEGLVILEAPLSPPGYLSSTMVIEEAQQRFPGVPLNAVITTAYAWNYIGGARDYVAAGIPVYVFDLYQPLLQRLVAAPLRRGAVSQFLPDLINAVNREKLEVDRAFSLHMPPFVWPVLVEAMTPMAN